MNFQCPTCPAELEKTDSGFGVAWVCPGCRGRAVTVSLLRQGVEKAFMNSLWQEARRQMQKGVTGYRKCPACPSKMVVVALTEGETKLELDVCPTCQFVWFDDAEATKLPMHEPTAQSDLPASLSPEAREAIALAQIKLQAERHRETEKLEQTSGLLNWADVAATLWRVFH